MFIFHFGRSYLTFEWLCMPIININNVTDVNVVFEHFEQLILRSISFSHFKQKTISYNAVYMHLNLLFLFLIRACLRYSSNSGDMLFTLFPVQFQLPFREYYTVVNPTSTLQNSWLSLFTVTGVPLCMLPCIGEICSFSADLCETTELHKSANSMWLCQQSTTKT